MHRPQNAVQKITPEFTQKLPALRKQCSQLAQYMSTEGDVGNVISIPNEIYSLCGNASMHSRIFVRDEYVRLMRMWNDSKHGFVLIGTPGIGKTHFGVLALLCCLGTTTPVILDNGHPEVLVFCEHSCTSVQYSKLNGMFTTRCAFLDSPTWWPLIVGLMIKSMVDVTSSSASVRPFAAVRKVPPAIGYP